MFDAASWEQYKTTVVKKEWNASVDRMLANLMRWDTAEGGQFDLIDIFLDNTRERLEAMRLEAQCPTD